jgi:4-hydroxybenzoate polyprenyltransferase
LVLTVVLFQLSPLVHAGVLALAALAAGGWLLARPGLKLFEKRDRAAAMALFTRASCYPPALLAIVVVGLLAGR